ncbi:MAG: class I SAM-dependent methyltransferase [Candidatus Neomarinimicrobiota bacterium]
MKVNQLADQAASSKKNTFLSSIFKKGVMNKFKYLQYGSIKIIEGDEILSFGDSGSNDKVTVTIHSNEFYVFLGSGGVTGVAEAYMAGYWTADNLVLLLQIVIKNKKILLSLDSGFAKIINPINKLIHWSKQNTLKGSKQNILAHYDLSNDFYKLWLDPTMTYSCGYFQDNSVSLEQASIEKIDRICRKLKLNKNDHILEIGTGWGSFSLHAAKQYGCTIDTVTISDAQYEYASKKIESSGLESQINILNKDYRKIEGKYDKIVSIEMIEAVGYQFIPQYFSKISSLLKEDGLVAIQGITYNDQNFEQYKNSVDFIKKYIFPGSCLVSVAQISDVIKEYTDLTIVDMEDITKHYAETLNRWKVNFLKVIPEVKKMGFSEAFIKMWEFYFVFCEAGFLERNIGDVQLVFSKSGARDIDIRY